MEQPALFMGGGDIDKKDSAPLPNYIYQQYVNARVQIHYGGYAVAYRDTGIVTFMDNNWIELTKDRGERLLVPLCSVRIIQLLKSEKQSDATTLLRPAGE